jgi:hypothetical protein
VLTRKSFRAFAIVVTLFTLAISLLANSSRAHAARRKVVSDADALGSITELMFEENPPDRQIKRISQSSLHEYDLNKDGHLSELESARATALIRESRYELDRYGTLLTSLRAWFE